VSKIEDTIQALLNQANDEGCTEAEAETFMNKAFNLMAKHNVEGVTAGFNGNDKIIRAYIELRSNKYVKVRHLLLDAIAEAHECSTIVDHPFKNEKGERVRIVVMYGTEKNVGVVQMMFAALDLQAARRMSKLAGKDRNGYILGFADSVRERLQKSAADECDGTLLPAIQDGLRRSEEAMSRDFPSIVKGSTSARIGSGYGVGQQDGRHADLGETKMRTAPLELA